jgi:hypothetical protein
LAVGTTDSHRNGIGISYRVKGVIACDMLFLVVGQRNVQPSGEATMRCSLLNLFILSALVWQPLRATSLRRTAI